MLAAGASSEGFRRRVQRGIAIVGRAGQGLLPIYRRQRWITCRRWRPATAE